MCMKDMRISRIQLGLKINKEKEQYLSFPGNQDELKTAVPSSFFPASSSSLGISSSKPEDSSPTRTLEKICYVRNLYHNHDFMLDTVIYAIECDFRVQTWIPLTKCFFALLSGGVL